MFIWAGRVFGFDTDLLKGKQRRRSGGSA
jgi:hypothetical protein